MGTWQFTVQEAAKLRGPLVSSQAVFYSHTLCPYAQRVFITLLHKQVPFQLVQVDLSNKPHWYRTINPKALVPAIHFEGIHTESLDICRWLDDTFHEPRALTPSQPGAARQMDQLLCHTSEVVAAGTTARSWGLGSNPSRPQQQQFKRQLHHLTAALATSEGPFLTGQKLCLADIALFPFIERFQMALEVFQGQDLAAFDADAVGQWVDTMRNLPICQMSSPAPGLFQAALQQHRSLDFFDYMSYPALKLHPQLVAQAVESM